MLLGCLHRAVPHIRPAKFAPVLTTYVTMATAASSPESAARTLENKMIDGASSTGGADSMETTEKIIVDQTSMPTPSAENKPSAEKGLGVKRPSDVQGENLTKRLKPELEKDPNVSDSSPAVESSEKFFRKKKYGIMMMYSGKDFAGMQRNPDVRTIEGDLMDAMLKAGVINEEDVASPGAKMQFQRAARTDKGVSAAGQLVSVKMFSEVEDHAAKISQHLCDEIQLLDVMRTTKGFDSKQACMARTYIYVCPTFAFTPVEQKVTESYRISDEVMKKVQETLILYKGTHNFHNFTSGKKANDPSAKRYIMDFTIGKPFIRQDREFAVLTVKGQSFMLHQIRKMIGLAMVVVRGLASADAIQLAWGTDKRDIPRAPGLGLVLDKLHYDVYNKRFGKDGIHKAIQWENYQERIDKFKEEFIFKTIYDTEKSEKSMLEWMGTLHLHHFGIIPNDGHGPVVTATGLAQKLVQEEKKKAEEEEQVKETCPKDTQQGETSSL